MIVPMKKVSLMTLGDRKTDTLKKLRRLGLVHIEMAESSGSRIDEVKEQIALLEGAVFSVSEKKNKKTVQKEATAREALAIAKEIALLAEERKSLLQKREGLHSEIKRLAEWGEFDPETVKDLSEKGVELSFYRLPEDKYGALEACAKTLLLERTKTAVKCMVIRSDAEDEAGAPAELEEYRLVLPQQSPEGLKKEAEALGRQIEAADRKIADYAVYADSMKQAVKACAKELEFEQYAAGMTDEALSADEKKGLSVAHFSGYIEAENLDSLKQAAKENAWGLLVDDPTEEDNVPTKLKNNRFVSLIYPLTDFLGTVPGYYEYDISGWFLAFILLFFGIIFGDGGYGLLICAAAAIPIVKALAAKKAVPPTFLLIGLFGLSTVLWGTVTCTWFGLPAEKLPQWLQNLSIPIISNVYADKIWYPFWTQGKAGLTTAQNLQIFCFVLALIQLTVAHIKVAARNRRSPKILGDIGAILQLWGIFYVVLNFVVNARIFSFGLVLGGIPVGVAALVMVAVGFVMSFVFANYEGNVLQSVLASLKNIISVLLGVVNVFSDIVSYIRLWAVGLAGAAISATVNELAGPLLGNFMFMILAIALLVFGHGLNMILNVLSVVVHGIRLNTLEFSSHLDMSWSGHKFEPFKE